MGNSVSAHSYDPVSKECRMGSVTGKSPSPPLMDAIEIMAGIIEEKSFPKGTYPLSMYNKN